MMGKVFPKNHSVPRKFPAFYPFCESRLHFLRGNGYNIVPKIQQRSLLFMKLGIVESEPVSETLRKRTNADKA